MKCGNCGTDLIPGETTCPNCHAVVSNEVNQESEETLRIEKLDEETVEETKPEIDPSMAPPTLDVNSENLNSNAQDIATANIDTYGKVEEEVKEEGKINKEISNVNFDIPSLNNEDYANIPSENVESVDGIEEISVPENQIDEEKKIELSSIEKKAKKGLKIKFDPNKKVSQLTFIIGLVLVFVLGLLIGKTLFSKNYCSVGNYARPTVTSDTPLVADGKNNVTQINGYTYKIPETYKYDKNLSGLMIYNDKAEYRIYIHSIKGSYDDIATSKVSLEASYAENGITVNSMKERQIENKSYVILEAATNQVNRLIAFTDAGDNNVFYIEIVTLDNSFNHEILTIANDIIVNAEYDKTVSKIEKIDIKDIANLTIKVANEHKKINK